MKWISRSRPGPHWATYLNSRTVNVAQIPDVATVFVTDHLWRFDELYDKVIQYG